MPTAFNDLYTLDYGDTSTFKWTKLDMGDQPAPPPRARHTATVVRATTASVVASHRSFRFKGRRERACNPR